MSFVKKLTRSKFRTQKVTDSQIFVTYDHGSGVFVARYRGLIALGGSKEVAIEGITRKIEMFLRE